ncbi:MAG: acyltransferase [Ruminococcaceae bacterium]|nr:acyltransferase [Oscillospiraceae bacterium]
MRSINATIVTDEKGENLLFESKERVIGLDILKILSCLGITMIHFLGYTNVISSFVGLHYNKVLAYIFNILIRTAVNIFIMISGYFLVKSKFKYRRLFSIWGETLVYSVLFFLIGAIFNLESLSFSSIVKAAFPILSRHYWFATSYIVLYLLSPFINRMVCDLSKKEYTVLVCGGAILFSVWTTFIWFSDGALTGGPTSILWVVFMYLVGGYIRLYPPKIKKHTLFIVFTLLVGALVVYQYLKENISFLLNFGFLKEDSCFSLILSVILFLLFKDIKSKNLSVNKIITTLSGASFGVYLIQENCMIRNWLWLEVVRSKTMVYKWYLFPIFLLVMVCLFAMALIISGIYKIAFEGICNKLEPKKDNN